MAGHADLTREARSDGFRLVSVRPSAAATETVPHRLLAHHDETFTANSIANRPPFCLKAVIETRFALADEMVHNGTSGKIALKNASAYILVATSRTEKKIDFSTPFDDWCVLSDVWDGRVRKIDEKRMVDLIRDRRAA